jgi:hypothetical protein
VTKPRRLQRRSVVSDIIERHFRAPGTALSRAEVREASVRGDRDALRRLVEERGALEGEQEVHFGLELPGGALAGQVAGTLREEGYAIELERGEGRALIVATTRLVLDEDTLRERTERFCALADRYAGRYRGFAL